MALIQRQVRVASVLSYLLWNSGEGLWCHVHVGGSPAYATTLGRYRSTGRPVYLKHGETSTSQKTDIKYFRVQISIIGYEGPEPFITRTEGIDVASRDR